MTETGSTAARRAAIIINPAKSTDVDVRELITRQSEENGWGEPIWLETTKEDPGLGQAKEALEQGADVVIAAGGDGTVRAVAEALAGTDTPLGLVPLGTGNLLARNLGLDVTDIDSAVTGALMGTDRRIDVVRAVQDGPPNNGNEKVFLVMAGLGYDATIMADTDEDLKDKVGWLAYVDAGIRNLPGKPVKAIITIDGRDVAHRRVRSVMVGNCGKVQGGVEIFPDAKVDDGLLDVVVLAPRGRLGWFNVIAGMIGKGRGKDSSVEYYQGKTVEVRLEHAEDYQLDGDHEGDNKHVTMTLEPAALAVRMAAPAPTA
ncbi:diacylglycerol kinase family protein [Pseudarthrobacter sp. J75]|uniref:diacylglycerol/lipid kinase family protein n=1 Tax=unclassified Pseudarthrobacter TaxID=2647000 RepID=UPI002E823A90|nr:MULTISPECIES: diacylglycerol kinase family protein [unclassified Pseudarthrobacter]MEE2523650.1 diacylglycerol kinase family protein [Pseudarthrobacter sp. J47]MEE2530040.1 diacylglycerol kinase family protein [Pseudarthrobacter sp. J75]MEE2570550.1 diacylglycerol kinase family protein [Pseudarthrobacter sp. J64]